MALVGPARPFTRQFKPVKLVSIEKMPEIEQIVTFCQ
jgi:hypothetical protein